MSTKLEKLETLYEISLSLVGRLRKLIERELEIRKAMEEEDVSFIIFFVNVVPTLKCYTAFSAFTLATLVSTVFVNVN